MLFLSPSSASQIQIATVLQFMGKIAVCYEKYTKTNFMIFLKIKMLDTKLLLPAMLVWRSGILSDLFYSCSRSLKADASFIS
jgi:hypothetical protein